MRLYQGSSLQYAFLLVVLRKPASNLIDVANCDQSRIGVAAVHNHLEMGRLAFSEILRKSRIDLKRDRDRPAID